MEIQTSRSQASAMAAFESSLSLVAAIAMFCWAWLDWRGRRKRRITPVKHPLALLLSGIFGLALAAAIYAWDSFFGGVPLFFWWGIALPSALAGAFAMSVWGRSIDRAKRSRLGHCPCCNYNLAGNTSGTCPECGTPIGERSAR